MTRTRGSVLVSPSAARSAVVGACLAVLLGAPAPSSADERLTEDEADRKAAGIIRTTQSPFCPGQTLDSCPSSRAAEWRTDIRTWTADGVPPEEIRDRLQARVPGFDLSNRPIGTGPLFAGVAVVSVIALAFGARRLVRRSPAPDARRAAPGADAPPTATGPRDAYDEQLDRELERL